MSAEEDDNATNRRAAFERLNGSFYETSPAPYFDHRLNHLLVAAASAPEYRERLLAGIRLGDGTATVDPTEYIASDLPPEELVRFITAESLVLHSHTVETLLHMFIAHRGQTPCPWFDMTHLPIRQFFAEVDLMTTDETWTPEVKAGVAHAFLGDSARPSYNPISDEEWEANVDRICHWLRFLAERLDENRPIYNATKHGFGANPSTAFFQILDESQNPLVSHEGPSLEALTWDKWDATDQRIWSLTTRWYDPERLWAETVTAIRLIHDVWAIGRSRYCTQEPVETYVPTVSPTDGWAPRGMKHFSQNLLVETKPPKPGT